MYFLLYLYMIFWTYPPCPLHPIVLLSSSTFSARRTAQETNSPTYFAMVSNVAQMTQMVFQIQ